MLDQFKFMSTILKLYRETAPQMANPHDVATIKAVYMQNRSLFTWPRDDREATAVLTDFFSDANFIKRLQLH